MFQAMPGGALWMLVVLSWTCRGRAGTVPVQNHPDGGNRLRQDQEDSLAKRSIVLVDEDFDVPQVHDVAKDGNAFDYEFDILLEGSGEKDGEVVEIETEVLNEEETKPTTKSTGGRDTEQETDPTTTFTDESTYTVPVTKATSKPTQNATDKSKTKTTLSSLWPKSSSKAARQASDPTKDTTTSVSADATMTGLETSDSNLVSSGDASVSSEQLVTTDDGLEDERHPLDYVSELCWNTTCEDADLWIQPEGMALVAEGTNLTLTCRGNFTDHHVLYWYGGNSSSLFEQTFAFDQSVFLNVPDARAFHSGLYRCVRWVSVQICCYREIRITVYEVPSYKYHIAVGALVAASLMLACIWLQVRQTKRYAVYSKEFASKHGKTENLLWK